MDEHSPYFDPDLSDPLPEGILGFLKSTATAAIMGVGAALVAALLVGCDSAELDRLQAAQEQRDRIARACFPEEGQRITVSREDGFIYFTYIDIGPGRYSRTFPHAEIRLATLKDDQ